MLKNQKQGQVGEREERGAAQAASKAAHYEKNLPDILASRAAYYEKNKPDILARKAAYKARRIAEIDARLEAAAQPRFVRLHPGAKNFV
ncbi:hypothetical protein GPECTOR_47g322 [Gonium pectorale]|uniref:Uncharacterized protein n=1 Tax=Gonium pectorale TaxID=33097 RepID=A0A150G874_GONPE|nr:hypothetical protein GPECTOR_47g322 [Gonium pectorale]|eukprot:KXZ46047.1 hypothetical protein GPECTOR_47g322 [Gonium pectorale]